MVYLNDKFYASDWQQFFPAINDMYNKVLRTTDTEQQKTFIKQGLALAAQNMGLIIPVMADQLLPVFLPSPVIASQPAWFRICVAVIRQLTAALLVDRSVQVDPAPETFTYVSSTNQRSPGT